MKTYIAFAESSSAFKLTLQANSFTEAWSKAEKAAEDGKFKEIPMSGDFNIYLVNEVIQEEDGHTS